MAIGMLIVLLVIILNGALPNANTGDEVLIYSDNNVLWDEAVDKNYIFLPMITVLELFKLVICML